jgi:hypothetical protein
MTGLELALKRSSDSAQNIAAKEFAAKILKRLVLRMSNTSPAGAAKSILRGCWRISSLEGTVPVWDGLAVEDKVRDHKGRRGKKQVDNPKIVRLTLRMTTLIRR